MIILLFRSIYKPVERPAFYCMHIPENASFPGKYDLSRLERGRSVVLLSTQKETLRIRRGLLKVSGRIEKKEKFFFIDMPHNQNHQSHMFLECFV